MAVQVCEGKGEGEMRSWGKSRLGARCSARYPPRQLLTVFIFMPANIPVLSCIPLTQGCSIHRLVAKDARTHGAILLDPFGWI